MANYGVALWFAILSTSPAICHEHADGEADHSHGLGFFSTSPLLICTCSPESELAPQSRHYHLVLLGIEITILPGCAAVETGILPAHNDSAITVNADHQAGLIAEYSTVQDFAVANCAEDALVVAACSHDSDLPAEPPSPPCTPARALRSGIQLI
jgi:hypothetical protein